MPDNKVWMAENLDYQFVSVTTDPGSANSAAMCYYNNEPQTYGKGGTYKCGALYNRLAMEYLENNASTLLPEGWRVPYGDEYNVLMNKLRDPVDPTVIDTTGYTIRAKNNSITSNWPSDWNGIDSYGFNALPTGDRGSNFGNFGTRTTFLKSRKYKNGSTDNTSSRFRLSKDGMYIENAWELYPATWFYSLRLVKDAT
jgi:uncharacterized protein (TIGR02145 family)